MSGADFEVVRLTLLTALGATALNLPLAVLAGWGLARWSGAGRVATETVLSLPLVLPPTAVGLVLLQALAVGSPFGRLLDALGVEVMFTWKGVVLASAVMSFPLLVRSARTAFAEVDPRLVGVARTLGASRWGAFWRVELPLAAQGVVAGTVLAFARALGEFGATILIAGNIPGRTQTLALAIYHRVQMGKEAQAWPLVALTTLIAFAAIAAAERIGQRRQGEVRG